jgi:hypothetical protein
VSTSPYRVPAEDTGLINPWRVPQRPHGGPAADSSGLHELYRLRQRCQLESSDDRTWGIVGLLGCVFVLLVLPLGIFLGGWFLLIALKLGLLKVGAGYLVTHLRRKARQTWREEYCAMYFRLATTSLPLALAHAEQSRTGTAVGTALLSAARCSSGAAGAVEPTELGQALEPLRPLRDLRLSLPVRARFAALYDYFYFPQEELHSALSGADS